MLDFNGVAAMQDLTLSSFSGIQHEAAKERGQRVSRGQRKNVRDVLVRPHHHQATVLAVDAAQGVDVLVCVLAFFIVGFRQRAEGFLIVAQRIAALAREQQLGQGGDGKRGVAVLKHGAHIKNRIQVCTRWRKALEWGVG